MFAIRFDENRRNRI